VRVRIGFGLIVGLVVYTGSVALACWEDLPLKELVSQNPVIVIGKIDKVDVVPAPKEGESPYTLDTAYITVTKVLKNTLSEDDIKVGDLLPLAIPSINRKAIMSTDIRHTKGQDGVWLLVKEDRKYWATCPGAFQPKDKESEIAKLLKNKDK